MAKTKRKTVTTRRKKSTRQPVHPEDLLEFQLVSTPRISPDGTRIVFVKKHVGEKNEYVTNLWMVDADGGEPRQFTSGGKDSAPQWSPDGDSVVFISGREEKRSQVFVINADGGEATKLTKLPEGTINSVRWSPDGSMLAVAFRPTHPDRTEKAGKERKDKGLSDPPWVVEDMWYRLDGDGYFGDQRFALYIVDAATGEHRLVYDKDAMGWFTFDWSPDSKKLVVSTNRDRRAMIRWWKFELLVVDVATGRIRPIPGIPEGPKESVRWSPDGHWIAYAGRIGRDAAWGVKNTQLFVCDATKGGARCLTAKSDYCLTATTLSDAAEAAFEANFAWTADSARILMKIGWHGESHVAVVPRRGGKVEFLTTGRYCHDLFNLSRDGSRVALTRADATHFAEVHLGIVGRDGIETIPLTDVNGPLLKQRTLAGMKQHWVSAPDGTKVQVWQLLPPTVRPGSRRKLPAVLQIHGGPHAQYGVTFFHEMQVLASAGYAVFMSNPRGSKGYGEAHCEAIRGAWGDKDWIDIQAVTDFMRSHPNVDVKRMGVMGGSYGGYMTNWVIGHTRVFRAAITDRCVSNLVSMAGNSDFIENPDEYFPGNFWDRPEARWEQSPIRYFGKVRTPTLIIHSEGDLRCNIEQAEQVFAALKLRNVPVRFVRYPRSTSHGMSRAGAPDMRMHRLGEILRWWDRYLKA